MKTYCRAISTEDSPHQGKMVTHGDGMILINITNHTALSLNRPVNANAVQVVKGRMRNKPKVIYNTVHVYHYLHALSYVV